METCGYFENNEWMDLLKIDHSQIRTLVCLRGSEQLDTLQDDHALRSLCMPTSLFWKENIVFPLGNA